MSSLSHSGRRSRLALLLFALTAVPTKVRATNVSYGFLKDEHSYVVNVEERDGQPLPASLECPVDEYRDDYDCKHKVALATVTTASVSSAIGPSGGSYRSRGQSDSQVKGAIGGRVHAVWVSEHIINDS
jgi:hypothetical protein